MGSIVLVGLDELWSYQFDGVTKTYQLARPKWRALPQVYEELGHLVAQYLFLDDSLAKLVDSVQLKHVYKQAGLDT